MLPGRDCIRPRVAGLLLGHRSIGGPGPGRVSLAGHSGREGPRPATARPNAAAVRAGKADRGSLRFSGPPVRSATPVRGECLRPVTRGRSAAGEVLSGSASRSDRGSGANRPVLRADEATDLRSAFPEGVVRHRDLDGVGESPRGECPPGEGCRSAGNFGRPKAIPSCASRRGAGRRWGRTISLSAPWRTARGRGGPGGRTGNPPSVKSVARESSKCPFRQASDHSTRTYTREEGVGSRRIDHDLFTVPLSPPAGPSLRAAPRSARKGCSVGSAFDDRFGFLARSTGGPPRRMTRQH